MPLPPVVYEFTHHRELLPNEALVVVDVDYLVVKRHPHTRGFLKKEPTPRWVASWIKEYKASDTQGKVNMLFRDISTHPTLVYRAFMIMKDWPAHLQNPTDFYACDASTKEFASLAP